MKPDDLKVGVRVITNRKFPFLRKGIQGTIVEKYGSGEEAGVMVRWDQIIFDFTSNKSLIDGFNLKKESQHLDPAPEPKEEDIEDIDTVRCSCCGEEGPKRDGRWSFRPPSGHPFYSAWWHHCPNSPMPQANPWQAVPNENWEFYSQEYKLAYGELPRLKKMKDVKKNDNVD
ncbi:MAG: hypothetical protein KAU06_04690 [Candidatus Marinimicrobia bacterium]|nr:hypothetical protein [Candidatus Neomarinimicrobiota bacterium]